MEHRNKIIPTSDKSTSTEIGTSIFKYVMFLINDKLCIDLFVWVFILPIAVIKDHNSWSVRGRKHSLVLNDKTETFTSHDVCNYEELYIIYEVT